MTAQSDATPDAPPLDAEERATPAASKRQRTFMDLRPLTQSPAMARLWTGTTISNIGQQMAIMTIGLELFARTGSAFAVGLLGAATLIPALIVGLYGGSLVDAVDRRVVAVAAATVGWTSAAVLALHAWFQWDQMWLLYAIAAVSAASGTLSSTARGAIVPRLVSRELLPAATALTAMTMGIGVTVGPAVGAIVVGTSGYAWAYTVDVILFSAMFFGVVTLPPIRPTGEVAKAGLGSVLEGLRFLRQARNIRAGFLLDISAMSFGWPKAIFPALGMVVLGGAETTVAILTAGVAVGTILGGLFSGPFGRVIHHGRAVVIAVACYGIAIFGFGVVVLFGAMNPAAEPGQANWLAVGLAAGFLVLSGVADNASAVFRGTMMQSAAPDEMRGRMQGIYIVVVTSGPRVGEVFYGVLATVLAIWAPALIGALLILLSVFLVVRSHRSLLQYDARHPQP